MGSCQFQYYQGCNKNVSKNTKFRETRKEKLTGDHAESIKTKKLTQPSKKVGCPVTFVVKKIYSIPEHKISADTKRQRANASIKLRDMLSNILKSCEETKSRDFKLLDIYSTSHAFLQMRKIFM